MASMGVRSAVFIVSIVFLFGTLILDFFLNPTQFDLLTWFLTYGLAIVASQAALWALGFRQSLKRVPHAKIKKVASK